MDVEDGEMDEQRCVFLASVFDFSHCNSVFVLWSRSPVCYDTTTPMSSNAQLSLWSSLSYQLAVGKTTCCSHNFAR